MLIVIGTFIAALGLPFFIRGLMFTLRPQHAMSLRARERNLRLGLESDITVWGKRVRRFGFLLLLIGGALITLGVLR